MAFFCSRGYIYSISCQTSVPRIKKPPTSLRHCQRLTFVSVQVGPRTTAVVFAVTVSRVVFLSSVEALASTLVPVAVDHQADDDEEDATQHGEERCEENGYPAHPFFLVTQSE